MMLVECGSKDLRCKVHWFLNGYPCLKTNKEVYVYVGMRCLVQNY
ncbi:hypothetical protein MtrunA17_Chr6g0484531 [Medicago truncatula]|uniref:Uncharacterized protein n=1 Tax=Medicago truncatula TaxID=3880 RepID=A0A396HHK9_MEDTR|nr:hypothetical protein MtrunA17_Chr6g0484531 [Medicago truncatula]